MMVPVAITPRRGARLHPSVHGILHRHPPLTPAGVLLRYRFALPVIVGLLAFLATAAAIDDGSLLRMWDEPVQEAAENARTPWLDRVIHGISQLGGTTFVVVGLAILLVPVLLRCRSLGLALLAATVARPLLEWMLKGLIDRPRPDLERLVEGTGPSFPSGHVMAAVALWGLLPPIVALVTHRRRWWWASVLLSSTVILLVAAARVYLGVHWLSDVVGALVLGSVYLLGVELLLDWHHERVACKAFIAHGHDLDEDLATQATSQTSATSSSGTISSSPFV